MVRHSLVVVLATALLVAGGWLASLQGFERSGGTGASVPLMADLNIANGASATPSAVFSDPGLLDDVMNGMNGACDAIFCAVSPVVTALRD